MKSSKQFGIIKNISENRRVKQRDPKARNVQEILRLGDPCNFAKMEETFRAHTESARMQMYKHQAAWWKSQYVAAQYENKLLRTLLDNIYGTSSSVAVPGPQSPNLIKRKKNKKKKKVIRQPRIPISDDSDDDVEYEISEEFKQFLDVNREHREKRELEKALQKKARGSESETERVERMEQEPTDEGDRLRREQLRQLYGDSWKIVEGLETHVQMKYDQFCDRTKAVYWPNIPLNL